MKSAFPASVGVFARPYDESADRDSQLMGGLIWGMLSALARGDGA